MVPNLVDYKDSKYLIMPISILPKMTPEQIKNKEKKDKEKRKK